MKSNTSRAQPYRLPGEPTPLVLEPLSIHTILAHRPLTTLNQAISSANATTIYVMSSANISNLAYLQIDNEIVQVTSVGQNGSLTVTRGVNGTMAAPSHASGAGVTDVSNRSNTTSVDEAGVSRTSYADGLGRLIQVTENGIGANTTYTYDALDNLTMVTPPSPDQRELSITVPSNG